MRSTPLLALAATLVASRAFAQETPSGSDVAAAQVLFDEGKRLMAEKHFDQACPKLVESQRLDPGGGTLLAIALCHEGEGKLATAWGDFNVALMQARHDRRPERETAALDHIRALEPRLARLRVVVASPAQGLEVRRDGALVGAAEWGTALPIDPGDHHFEARAPGKVTWQGTVPVNGEGKTIDVAIPALEDAPPPPTATPTPAPTASPTANATPAPPSPPNEANASSPLRPIAYVTGAVGLVSIGIGAVFGATAQSRWHDAQRACPSNTCTNANDAQLGSDAGSAADLSTVFFAVGGAALVAGVVMFVLAPSDSPHAAAVRVSPLVGRANGLAIGGDL
jgi:hypothetical protein